MDFDACERTHDILNDPRCYLAERGETVAQPFLFFELFDAGQVLDRKRRAGQPPAQVVEVANSAPADDLVRALQPQLLGADRADASGQRLRRRSARPPAAPGGRP